MLTPNQFIKLDNDMVARVVKALRIDDRRKDTMSRRYMHAVRIVQGGLKTTQHDASAVVSHIFNYLKKE